MTTHLRGSLRPFRQRRTIDFDPVRGYLIQEDYKGISESQIEALMGDYASKGIACRMSIWNNGISTLETEDSTYQYTIDSWQVVGNDLNVDALSHPTMAAILTEKDIRKLRQAIESKSQDWEDVYASINDTTHEALIKRFYRMQLLGQTEYRRQQYVLRHTTNAPNRWSANIADFGVEKIYTPAKLLTEVQDSSLWVFPLPPRLVYKISNIPVPTPQSNYLWGYLKSPSTETTAANNRIDISTEYCPELWSTDYYGVY